jgi:hypothetical protein
MSHELSVQLGEVWEFLLDFRGLVVDLFLLPSARMYIEWEDYLWLHLHRFQPLPDMAY